MASKTLNTILSLQDKTSSKLVKVSGNFKNLSKEAQKATLTAQKSLNNLGKGIERTVTSAAKLGGKALFAGITAIGGYSIIAGSQFEQSMSKVKALSGATGQDFEALKEKAKEMGANTSKSASESADALGYMALAGWNTNQMLSGLEPILRASEAGEMDLATCSDLVTDSMSAMGITTDNLGHYLDVCTKAQSSSNTSLQGLLEAYVACGGTMKNLNVSVEESATVLGTLANRGKKGAEAGNALNSIMVNLTGGSSSAKGAMDKLGVSAWDSKGRFIGLKATLLKLKDALSKCTDEQRNNFESAIGGKTQLDTLQAMISGVSEEYDDLNGKLNDCNGYMTEAAKTMQDNLKGKVTALKSAIEGVGISLYEGLQGPAKAVIDKILQKVQQFQNKLNELKENGTLEKVSNNIANALTIAYDVLSKFINFIIKHKDIVTTIASMAVAFIVVTKAIRGLSIAIKAFQLVWAILNGTIMLSPIGWVVLGITALVGAFVLAYQKSETFRNAVQFLLNKIIELGAGIMAWANETILPIIQSIAMSVSNFWNGTLSPFLSWALGVLAPVFGGVWDTICQYVTAAFSSIGQIIQGSIEIYQGIIDFLTGVFSGNWEQAWNGIKETFSGIIDGIKGIWDGLRNFLSTPLKAVVNISKHVFGDGEDKADTKTAKNATGTDYFKGGWTTVGEHGPELMKLPGGTKIKTNSQSMNAVKQNNLPMVNVIIQGNVIGNEEFANSVGEHIYSKILVAMNNV